MNLDPEVYRKASELLSHFHTMCACTAIYFSVGSDKFKNSFYQDAFREHFYPQKKKVNPAFIYWWSDPHKTDKDQLPRMIALDLMAEIVEGNT